MLHLPIVKRIRTAQFILAILIYLFYALSPGDQIHLTTSDKYMHFLGNGLLCLSAWVCFFGRVRALRLMLLLIIFSLTVELCQYFSPGRSVDVADMVANMTGLAGGFVLACCAHFLLRRYWPDGYGDGKR